jgi:hypothetical protein
MGHIPCMEEIEVDSEFWLEDLLGGIGIGRII